MAKRIGVLFAGVITYFLAAIYLLNIHFDIISIPDIVKNANEWIIFAGGILLMSEIKLHHLGCRC